MRYTIGEPTADWTTIEFFDGDLLLKRIQVGDAARLEVEDRPMRAGYAVYHALVTMADGSRRTTMPRRMFVRAQTGRTSPASGAMTLTISQRAPAGSIAAGTPVTLSVNATSWAAVYRWYRDGVALTEFSGASAKFLASQARAGRYEMVVEDDGRSAAADLGTLHVTSNAWLVNLSARGWVDAGDNVLSGFVVTGETSGTVKRVVVRGIGPELSRFIGMDAAIDGVKLTWMDRGGITLQSATEWDPALAPLFARLGASALTPAGGDAAMERSFAAPGVFTAHVAASHGPAGIGMVEVYDADDGAPGLRLVKLTSEVEIAS